MSRLNKLDLGTSFFTNGRECIKSADLLFHDKKRGCQSQYGILLIHGIELLLKSYLLFKNTALVDDPKKIESYLKSLGHKYCDIYKECLKYGAELNDPIFYTYFTYLSNTFYEDSVGVRYIENSGLVSFDPIIFVHLDQRLIKAIHNLYFPSTEYIGDYD